MGHSAFPGDQSSCAVTKVPAEADISCTEVLAGIMEVDAKSDGSVLDEVCVILVYVIDLGE